MTRHSRGVAWVAALSVLLFSLPVRADDVPVLGEPAPKIGVIEWVVGPEPDAWPAEAIVLVTAWPIDCELWCEVYETDLLEAWNGLFAEHPRLIVVVALPGAAEDIEKKLEQRPALASGAIAVARVRDDNWLVGQFRHHIIAADGTLAWTGKPWPWADNLVIDALERGDWEATDAVERMHRLSDVAATLSGAASTSDLSAQAAAADAVFDAGLLARGAEARITSRIALGQATAAYLLIDDMVTAYPDDAQLLNGIAWAVVTAAAADRDLDLALELAERSNVLSEHGNAAYLDTLARVHYERGDIERALELQREAVTHLTEDHPQREHLELWLERYETEAGTSASP